LCQIAYRQQFCDLCKAVYLCPSVTSKVFVYNYFRKSLLFGVLDIYRIAGGITGFETLKILMLTKLYQKIKATHSVVNITMSPNMVL
jgi:hypothetical protein